MSAKRKESVRLIWLESLEAAAESKSWKEAGEKIDLDPTVVKKNISKLEKWLDRGLVYRTSRHPKMTEDGQEFIPRAKAIIELLYTSRDFMIDKNNAKDMSKHMRHFFARYMKDQKK